LIPPATAADANEEEYEEHADDDEDDSDDVNGQFEDEDDDDDDDDDDEDDELDPIDPSAPASLGTLAEWSERKLCPDGGCIGLLGDDGTCKVCGKVGSAAKGRPAVSARPTASTERSAEDTSLEAAAAELAAVVPLDDVASVSPAPAVDAADDDGNRRLCPDGACVGVIGSDGRCKVCGKEDAA
jgi:hypothetical protein